MDMSKEKAKDSASIKALEFIKDGMHVGLGTGSTATKFIHHLIQSKRKIKAVATSNVSEILARKGNIPLLDINAISSLDVTVDGADEIDPNKRLIKGAGGALVREKIIASMSAEMIVIADESKLVDHLGKCRLLPVEIIPFGAAATKKNLEKLGLRGELRKKEKDTLYITDNGNWIIDLKIPSHLNKKLEELDKEILMIPGVVDSGFFFHLATRIIIGKDDGSTEER